MCNQLKYSNLNSILPLLIVILFLYQSTLPSVGNFSKYLNSVKNYFTSRKFGYSSWSDIADWMKREFQIRTKKEKTTAFDCFQPSSIASFYS
jgi:hypothetical protein